VNVGPCLFKFRNRRGNPDLKCSEAGGERKQERRGKKSTGTEVADEKRWERGKFSLTPDTLNMQATDFDTTNDSGNGQRFACCDSSPYPVCLYRCSAWVSRQSRPIPQRSQVGNTGKRQERMNPEPGNDATNRLFPGGIHNGCILHTSFAYNLCLERAQRPVMLHRCISRMQSPAYAWRPWFDI
jgi:hypothetical protein